MRFPSKGEAFQRAQELAPGAGREKAEGFVLLVGTKPQIFEMGLDRDRAVASAVEILEKTDTVVFVSKLQAKVGEAVITKDQLLLRRKV